MKLKLTPEQINELKEAHRKETNQKKADRIKAILLLNNAYTAEEISKILLVNINTITGWKTRYLNNDKGLEWLIDHYHGYDGKLSKSEEESVSQFVSNNLVSDSKQVQAYIKDTYGVEYSHSGVKNLLSQLGFAYKKTTLIPAKYDAKKQAKFKELYEEFIRDLKADEVILFSDGVHPQHNTKCSYAWIKKGETKTIKSNSGRKRINIAGSYNPMTQDIIINVQPTLNGENIIEHFKKIEAFYLNKASIYLVVDGAAYYHSEAVKKFLETSRIELIQLPSYSPNLNLIERLWKLMRKKVINNNYFEKYTDFKFAIIEFFNNTSQDFKSELHQFIGLDLHLFDSS